MAEPLRPGYKQTEIGIIPADWEVDEVQNHASITTGSRNTQDRIEDGKYPFFVRSQRVERIDTYSFDGEAVLTAGDGVGTGKVFHYANGKFDFHQRVYKISNFDEKLDGYYFYLFFSNHFLSRIMSMTAKSSVDSVRREMIANMLIPLPKMNEQRAIAAAVRDANELTDSLEELIDKKRNIKRGAMQQLLTGKKRLPSFNERWETRKLGDIADVTMGQSPESRYYNTKGNGLPLIQGNADIKERWTVASNFTTVAPKKGRKGVIIMSVRAPVGAVGRASFDCCLGRGVCGISYANDYLYHYLVFIEDRWSNLSTGSTFDSVNSKEVNSREIRLPSSVHEQVAIAKVLTEMDSEMAILETTREKWIGIKKGMMQELLTGSIRLT